MDIFIVFMMTLLLQSTRENADSKTQTTSEPDNSERFGEFCLRIESAPPLPTKAEEATKHATQQPKQPPQPTRQPPEPPKQPHQPTRQPPEPPKQPPQPTRQPPESPKQPPQPTRQPPKSPKQPPQPTRQPPNLPKEPPQPTRETPNLPKQPPQPTQLLEQPTPSDGQSTRAPTQSAPRYWESTQPPEDDQDPEEIVTQEVSKLQMPLMAPLNAGCRCQGEETKPSETSQVLQVMLRLPSQTCSSTEVIETLKDGREVCVTAGDFLSSYEELVRRFFHPVTAHQSNSKELLDTAPTAVDPTELPTTPPPPELTLLPSLTTDVDYIDYIDYIGVPESEYCGFCSIRTHLDNVGPEAVQSLNVMMQPDSCPAHVYFSLKDAEDLCLDEFFPQDVLMVEKLGISPPHEVIDGCRCREKEQKLPDEASPVISTRIWPPSETCNLTEFIETLTDGREVCVTASTILEYLLAAPIQRSAVPGVAPEGEKTRTMQKSEISGWKIFTESHAQSVGFVEIQDEFPVQICKWCRAAENLSNIDPNNVQSLEIHAQPRGCPASIHIWLKDGEDFCVSTPGMEQELRTLLKKLESPGH